MRFYIPRLEDEITFAFAFKQNFVSGYTSFLTREPSKYAIETLTKTSLWSLSYEDLQEIYQETQVGQALGRKASEALFLNKARREQALLTQTAEQRYMNLLTEQPEFIREIPLKYIASYIGITPQALSRIRKRIYR